MTTMLPPASVIPPVAAPTGGLSLRAHQLAAGYGAHRVLEGIDLHIEAGDFAVLIGPNGSGKSTLLRALARLIKPAAGAVHLADEPIRDLSSRQLARRMAVVPQSPVAPPALTVRELVSYGRSPFTGFFGRHDARDREVIDAAIERCELADLQHRLVQTLSGGERQRAWIAAALAQEPKVLLLDEPVSALDIGHQLEVLSLLQDLNHERGTTLVLVLHDLHQAIRFGRTLVALRAGNILASGPMLETLSEALLRELFGVEARILRDADLPHPMCLFERSLGGCPRPLSHL